MRTKLKPIVFFLPSFASGGAEKVMIGIANQFYADGLDVRFVVACGHGPAGCQLNKNIPLENLDRERLLFALPRLVRYLKRVKPAVVYSTMMHANIVTSVANLLSGQKARMVLREAVSLNMLRESVSNFKFWLWINLAKITYRRAFCVVCVSDALASELVAAQITQRKNLTTIYNPTFLEPNLGAEQQVDAALQEWGVTNPFVVAVGRLTDQKAFDVLIDAVADIRDRHRLAVLILGEGGLRSELLAQAKEKNVELFLPGYVANPELYISACDCFVLTSKYEGMPNALIQALACRARIISTDCPTGPNELLDNGRWGTLIPVGDVEALSSALVRMLAKPKPVDPQFGELSRFDQEQSVSRYKQAGGL